MAAACQWLLPANPRNLRSIWYPSPLPGFRDRHYPRPYSSKRRIQRKNVNACNVLDVVHPLWMLAQETNHRRQEILAFMEAQITLITSRWVDGKGFAFAPGQSPGLQGTEMWLSIMYLAADALGASSELGYTPRGVHRTISDIQQLSRTSAHLPPQPKGPARPTIISTTMNRGQYRFF